MRENFEKNRKNFALVTYAKFLEVKTEIKNGVIFRTYVFQTNIGEFKKSFEIANNHFYSMDDKDLAEFDKNKIEILKVKFNLKK